MNPTTLSCGPNLTVCLFTQTFLAPIENSAPWGRQHTVRSNTSLGDSFDGIK